MLPKVGDNYQIQSYKHSGSIHRIWKNTTILYSDEDLIVCVNNKTKVVESNGSFWKTKEPAVCYFFKKHWFNVIGILKPTGICYYCNLASPFVCDEEAIKYIDYDLDVRVKSDFKTRVVDRDEYQRHSKRMNYSETLKKIIEEQLEELLQIIKEKKEPFEHGFIKNWFNNYKKMRKS